MPGVWKNRSSLSRYFLRSIGIHSIHLPTRSHPQPNSTLMYQLSTMFDFIFTEACGTFIESGIFHKNQFKIGVGEEIEITGKENVRYGEPIREMSSDKSEIELVEKKNSKAECSSSMCILVLL